MKEKSVIIHMNDGREIMGKITVFKTIEEDLNNGESFIKVTDARIIGKSINSVKKEYILNRKYVSFIDPR